MSDEDREFKIRITGDASGLVSASGQAGQSLENVKSGMLDGVNPALLSYDRNLGKAAEGTERMSMSHRDLTRVLRMVNPQLGELGHLWHLVEANPILASAAAALVLAEAVKKIRENMIPDTAELGIKSLAPGFDAARGAVDSAQQALLEFHNSLQEVVSTEKVLGAEMERATAQIEAQKEAAQATDDAEKKLALAQLELAKATGTVTGPEYEQQKQRIDEEAERRAFAREKDSRDEKVKRQREQADALDKAGREAFYKIGGGAADKAEEAAAAVAAKEKVIATAEENNKKYMNMGRPMSPGETRSFISNVNTMEAAKAELPELKAAAKAAADALNKLEQDAKNLPTQAQALRESASGTEAANATWSEAQEKALRLSGMAHATQAEAKAMGSPEGKLLTAVSGAEYAQQHGQKLTLAQQGQIAALHQLLDANGVNAGLTLQLLGRLHNNQEALNRKMQDILKKIQNASNNPT